MPNKIIIRTNKKTHQKFPIIIKSRSTFTTNLTGSVKSSGRKLLTERGYRQFLNKKMLINRRNPQKEKWHSASYKMGNYSFRATKKDGMLDYYIEVKSGRKKFLSIPLKPLINRGISFGLSQLTGFPVDVEFMAEKIQEIIAENKLDGIMNLAEKEAEIKKMLGIEKAKQLI